MMDHDFIGVCMSVDLSNEQQELLQARGGDKDE